MDFNLFQIAIVVKDYDDAIAFYTKKLGFILLEDTPLTPEKRWVVLSPSTQSSCHILLAKAKNEEELSAVGKQTGGRVFLFIYTSDIMASYNNLIANQVTIARPIEQQPYGKVMVFEDLYGNLWDVIEQL
jgi:catechol 2,3-dioxygenase-like lactoylglutathione lyase family enzyme